MRFRFRCWPGWSFGSEGMEEFRIAGTGQQKCWSRTGEFGIQIAKKHAQLQYWWVNNLCCVFLLFLKWIFTAYDWTISRHQFANMCKNNNNAVLKKGKNRFKEGRALTTWFYILIKIFNLWPFFQKFLENYIFIEESNKCRFCNLKRSICISYFSVPLQLIYREWILLMKIFDGYIRFLKTFNYTNFCSQTQQGDFERNSHSTKSWLEMYVDMYQHKLFLKYINR